MHPPNPLRRVNAIFIFFFISTTFHYKNPEISNDILAFQTIPNAYFTTPKIKKKFASTPDLFVIPANKIYENEPKPISNKLLVSSNLNSQ
jgi:hypothetical protein